MSGQYLQPRQLGEALDALGRGHFSVLAGGTDFYPARVGRPVEADILDITRVAELRGVGHTGEGWRIGATTTWSELLAAGLPPLFEGVKAAAREVGGRQIQNAGTVAGNLCNASPAADGVPPLLALGAEVELASVTGTRRLALEEFVLGNRRTARAADELLVAIHVPDWPATSRGVFRKLGHRRYLVISIVMVAATVALDASGRIARCGVAVGACSAAARRLHALEARLAGLSPAEALKSLAPADLAGLSPIDDVRGSAEYRLDAAFTLTRQALEEATAG